MTSLLLFLTSCLVARIASLVSVASSYATPPSSFVVDRKAYSSNALNGSEQYQIFSNTTLANSTLDQWTPCNLHYTIPNSQYALIIYELGANVPLGLLQIAYHEALVFIQRHIDEGRGAEMPSAIYVQPQDLTAIAVAYKQESLPHGPTNWALIGIIQALWDITADRAFPKPNPPFSRETKFGLAPVNGPSESWGGRGMVAMVETHSDVFASS